MRARVVFLTAVALLGVGGCARRMPPQATSADAERANVELAQLEQGRKLVVSRCGSRCHKPPMPGEHPAAAWPKALDEMAPRAHVTAMERDLIEQYLVTLASR